MSKRNAVLSLYRNLIRQSKLVTEESKRLQYLERIRTDFRKNKNAPEDQIDALLKEGDGKLRFLKMITPKTIEETKTTRQVYVVQDGKVVNAYEEGITFERQEKARTNWDGKNIDPDALKRHEYLLKRMQFKEGPLKNYPKNVWGIPKW